MRLQLFILGVGLVASSEAIGLNYTCDTNPETNSDQLLCIPSEYRQYEAPTQYGLTRVTITITLQEIVSVTDNLISLSCYFNTEWKDARIRRRLGYGRAEARPGVDYRNNPNVWVKQDKSILEHIWRPDTFIYHLKRSEVANMAGQDMTSVWIATDGSVLTSFPFDIELHCPMDVSSFPFDFQTCKFKVGSYSKDNTKMIFDLNMDHTTISDENGDTFFQGVPMSKLTRNFNIIVKELDEADKTFNAGVLGNFSITGIQFEISRKFTNFLTTFYLPSLFVVIISWIRYGDNFESDLMYSVLLSSFLIPCFNVTARSILLTSCMLTLIFISNQVYSNTPRSPCMNALEVWMFICICSVFGAALEFGALLLKRTKACSKTLTVENVKYEAASNGISGTNDDPLDGEEYWKIDRYYLVLFPLLFLVTNVAYWLAYTV